MVDATGADCSIPNSMNPSPIRSDLKLWRIGRACGTEKKAGGPWKRTARLQLNSRRAPGPMAQRE